MNTGLILILFLIAADGVIGIHVLQMPIVSCTLVGLATGNTETALQAGAMAQIIYMLLRDDGFESGLFSALFVLAAQDQSLAVSGSGAVVGVLSGAALEAVFRLLNTLLLPKARKYAEKGDAKGLGVLNFVPLFFRAAVAAALGCLVYQTGISVSASLESSWAPVLQGLIFASVMVRFVGAAVILRNLMLRDMPGAFCAGAAVAVLFAASRSPFGLAACALLAFAAAAYDFHSRKKNESSSAVKGGAEKWW